MIDIREVENGILMLIGARSEWTEHFAILVTIVVCQWRRSWGCSCIP